MLGQGGYKLLLLGGKERLDLTEKLRYAGQCTMQDSGSIVFNKGIS